MSTYVIIITQSTNEASNMFFTKKQASITAGIISITFGILGGPVIGGMVAFGFFILLTA